MVTYTKLPLMKYHNLLSQLTKEGQKDSFQSYNTKLFGADIIVEISCS
jgi:hypothetical protein